MEKPDIPAGGSNIVPRATMAGKTVNVQVTEYFPGYQCSINNMDWSPAVTFDAATPFPDVRKDYFPIAITVDGWFPVVDELGSPLGIEIQPVLGNITYEALLRIEVVASSSFGVTGTLEIEFDRPGYYNGLRLSPFVNMPVSLTQIRAEGMYTIGTTLPIFEGDVLIDRPVSIRFADSFGKPIYVRRLYLDFYQPGYDLKQHVVNPADQARQNALARLQTVLPFSDRAVQGAVPASLVGAQYEFGLRDIAGERYNQAGPGVFVSGRSTSTACRRFSGWTPTSRQRGLLSDLPAAGNPRHHGSDRAIAVRTRHGVLVSGCLDRRRADRRGFLFEVGAPQRQRGADPLSFAGHQRGIACTTTRSQPWERRSCSRPAWRRRRPACEASR